MKIVAPSFEIVSPSPLNTEVGQEILLSVENAARLCYKSEGKISTGSAERLVKDLITRGHHAMLEFGPSIVVKFVANRGFSHELVRHRLASFAQESTRYVNYKEGLQLVPDMDFKTEEQKGIWTVAMLHAESTYRKLIELGVSVQEARGVLPNDLKTEILIKANIREWRHIFSVRSSAKAHPMIRNLMGTLLLRLRSHIPVLFDDVGEKFTSFFLD